jgi:uncharacterized protein (DUF433 family)
MHAVPGRSAARIIRDPQICAGDPIVEGTRTPVHSIVIQWRLYHDVKRLLRAFPHRDASAIRTALAFYEANRAEIDRLIEESEQAAYSTD